MKNKNKLLLLFIGGLITICLLIGASYAYFAVLLNTDGNNNKFSVKTENLGNIKWTGVKAYESDAVIPGEMGIQTFTVEKNSETGKGIYEIDLKGIVDEAFGSDIEITLYKTTEPDNNYVSVIEGKGKLTGSGTLHYTKGDSLNVTGTPKVVYGPRKLQTKDPIVLEQVDFDNETLEKTTYYLVYNYKDSGKSQDDQQGKSFSGEISVKLILDKSPALNSEMTVNYTSNRTDYVNTNETINITATSTYYDIVSYSFDNETYTSVPSASKEVTVTKTYEEETEETIYFKDTDDNIKSEKITTIKLDKTAPKITASASDIWASSNKLSITLKDEKSGLSGYQVTETETEPTEWTSVSGNDTTIEKEIISNNTYYIYGKDAAGNISHEKIKVTHVDNTPPTIISLTEQDGYGASSVITAKVKDEDTGITGYAFTETETEPSEWTSVNNVLTEETYTYTANENKTIYFWVKDGLNQIAHQSITVSHIDTTPPTLSVYLTDSDTWKTEKYFDIVLADEESGISGYQVTSKETEPTEWITASGKSYHDTRQAFGNGTYYVWVKNGAGLITHTSIEATKIDSIAPEVKVSYEANADASSITIDASKSTDSESGIAKYQFSIDAHTFYASDTGVYTFLGLSDGIYTIYIDVEDQAGNAKTEILDVVLDGSEPVIANFTIENEFTYSPMKEVRYTITDNVAIKSVEITSKYAVHGGNTFLLTDKQTTYEDFATITDMGSFTLTVTDFAGHTVTKNFEVYYIDKSPPTVTLDVSSPEKYEESKFLNWTAHDDGEIVSCSLTDESGTSLFSGTSSSDCSSGTYDVQSNGRYIFTATDSVGNKSMKDVEVTSLDKEYPSLHIMNVTPDEMGNVSVEITANDDAGIAKIVYRVDGPAGSSSYEDPGGGLGGTYYHTFNGLSSGPYTLFIEVTDVSGHTVSDTASFEITGSSMP